MGQGQIVDVNWMEGTGQLKLIGLKALKSGTQCNNSKQRNVLGMEM